jgi:tryptophan 2,3-dioxygenase
MMSIALPFNEVLEAIDTLSLDEQETLLTIIQRRFAERNRQKLLADVQTAREQFKQGDCEPVSVDSLMQEILS